MKNNLLSEKLVYTGDTRTPTHLHLVRYTPDEVHEYTADSLPPIEPQFSEKGMIWLQVHGLKETETVRQVCNRFGIDFLVMQDILNADHPTKVEEHERYMLVVAKFFRGGEEMQVCLVQGADFVLSFIESESPLFDDIPQAIHNNVLKFRSRPSDYLLSVLLNSITANYATLISKLDGDLDDLKPDCSRRPTATTRAARFRSCATGPFTLGVGHQGRNKFQNVLFAVDIGEGVIVHGLFEVDGVQDFQLVTVFQKCVPALDHDTTFRVSDHIGTVTL